MHPSCSSKAKFRLDDLHCVADEERLARTALAACPGYSYNRPRYLAVRVTCPAGTFVLTCLHLSPKYSGNSRTSVGDPYVFGPPGSASGSVGHKYESGSGSFYHQAKIVRKNLAFYCFVTSLWLFIFEEWCKCTRVLNTDPYVFGPPWSASASGSFS